MIRETGGNEGKISELRPSFLSERVKKKFFEGLVKKRKGNPKPKLRKMSAEDDNSPSSLVPRSAFYDVEAPIQQCSPRKGARIASIEEGGGGGGDALDDGTTAAAAAMASKPSPPKRVSFASHVQVSNISSSSSSSSKSKLKKTKSRDEDDDKDDDDDEEEEEKRSARRMRIVYSVLLLFAACAGLFAAGWSARGETTSASGKHSIIEGDLWQAAPSRGETVLGESSSRPLN